MKRLVLCFLVLVSIISCASYQENSAKSELGWVYSEIGDQNFFKNLSSLQISSSGSTYASHMGFKPLDVKQTGHYKKTYSFQLATNSIRTNAIRQFVYEPSHGFQEQRYEVVTRNGIGAVSDGAMPLGLPGGQLPSQTVASMEKLALLMNPHLLLKEIVQNKRSIQLREDATIEGKAHRVVTVADKISPILIFIGKETGLITKIETTDTNLLTRDSKLVVEFGNWSKVSDSMFPFSVTVSTSGNLLRKETRDSIKINPPLDDAFFTLPNKTENHKLSAANFQFGLESIHIHDEFFEIAGLYYAENSDFKATEIAPNIYELRDSSFSHLASMAILVDNHLVVLEAITSPKSADQLILEIKSLFPSQNIDYLVQSHHHVDHSSGVRSFIANGTEIVVGHGAADWWKKIAKKESSLHPDTLAKTPTPKINITETKKDGTWTLQGTEISVTAFHVSKNSHATDMLITAIETKDEIFLYVADLYNAGFGFTMSYDGPVRLFEAIKDLGLIDEHCKSSKDLMFVPSHGQKTTLADAVTELTKLGKAIGCPNEK